MSKEILREWAQTDAWNDLLAMFETQIDKQSRTALAKARSGDAKWEVGVVEGLALGHDILKGLRGNA